MLRCKHLQDGEASRQLFILGLLSFSFLSSTRTLDFCYKEDPKCMCVRARKSAHVCTHSTCARAYLIHSHAIKFQTTSTSATRLVDVLLVGRKIRGVTYLRSFRLKTMFSPQVRGSSHTYLPMLRRRKRLSKLTSASLRYVYIRRNSPSMPRRSAKVRSLEINKIIAPCTWGMSDGKRKINHQWGRCNKPTSFYTGNFHFK